MSRRSPLHLVFLLALFAACAGEADDTAERYGFVATLGADTTSVESITRVGDRIIGDAVGRSPLVVRRRWEATLDADGAIRHWVLRTHIPNAPEGATELYHAANLGDDVVTVVRSAGQDSTRRTFQRAFPAIVPWNAFLYGSWETLLEAARTRPDGERIGIYFFEGWSEGRFGYAQVRALGGDSVRVSSTGLAGSGVARVDSLGRLVAYSGAGTTYRQEVRRVTEVPDLDAIEQRFAEDERSRGVRTALSVRDTARGRVGAAEITVDYSQPLARGRVLLGELIPYGRVWRTGANAATHATFSAPVMVGEVAVDSGTYTLWTLPTEGAVSLILNEQTGQWGTGYRSERDLARVPMRIDTVASPVEAFTIRIDGGADRTGTLVLEWGTFRWSVPVRGR